MQKLIFLFIITVLIQFNLAACDACGCSISGNGLGILGTFRNNSVGLSWQTIRFQGALGHGEQATDDFNSIELTARYYLNDRLKVLVNLPYRYNQRQVDDGTLSLFGIGDARVVASYTVLRDQPLGATGNAFFEIGGGIKLPTGVYNPDLHDTDLPENFNVGNGNWGYVLQPNLILSHEQFGLVLGGVLQYFSKSTDDYRFGHQYSSRALLYLDQQINSQWQIIPNAGIIYEQISSDTYANGRLVDATSGSGTYATVGVNLRNEYFLLGVAWIQPLSTSYSNDEVIAKRRISCQLSYLF
ncbi:MAG: hypothetical protein AB8G22_20040 [Saprospiraceae bacterium]